MEPFLAFAILACWIEKEFSSGPFTSFINIIWANDDSMRRHLLNKWDEIYKSVLYFCHGRKTDEALIGPTAVIRFIGILDQENLQKLATYVIKNSTCPWASPIICEARRLFREYISVPRAETLLEFVQANVGDEFSEEEKITIHLNIIILYEDKLDILDGQLTKWGDRLVANARQKDEL